MIVNGGLIMTDNIGVFRIGPIRPPSEAESLLLQVTSGCTWNKCKFCSLYRGSKFKTYTVESIKENIDIMGKYRDRILQHTRPDGRMDHDSIWAEINSLPHDEQNCYYMIYNWLRNGGENVFLQDGNTIVLRPEKLSEVLRYLREVFPHIKRITSYGRAESLSKVSVEEFKELRAAGLDRIHSGYETGSDKVLEFINKGATKEQQIRAGQNIKAAGIELSLYFMPGVGGKKYSEENALETAQVINAINPDFVRIRTAVVKPDTDLWELYENGGLEICSEDEKLNEIKLLIENTEGVNSYLASDHIINLIQDLEGYLDRDKDKLIRKIDEYFSMSERDKKIYQLARRNGMVLGISDLSRIPSRQAIQLEQIVDSIQSPEEWDMAMNNLMENYI